jgi:hypothetical protein
VGPAVCSLVFAFFLALTAHAAPLTPQPAAVPPPSIPVDLWLNGPDRQDFPWKVQIARQRLTVQQRHLVQLLVTIRGRDLLKGVNTRDLHFVVKVADHNGTWLGGQSYSHFIPAHDFSPKDLLHPATNLYLRPGNYTVAVLAYDVLHNSGNVWHSKLIVPTIGDPLPELDSDLPQVEFLPAVDVAPELKTSAPWAMNRPGALAAAILDPLALGHGTVRLPVPNHQALRIDVVANLSAGMKPSLPYKFGEGLVLQVGNLLSQLAPQNGCVRFTALDILRQDLIIDRMDRREIDWDAVSKKIASAQLNVINVKALKEKETSQWFKRSLERITDDPDACHLPDEIPRHVLIVVSMPFAFPIRAPIRPVKPEKLPARSYYLEILFNDEGWDEVGTVLKPLQAMRLSFDNSLELRQKLALLVKDLTQASQ